MRQGLTVTAGVLLGGMLLWGLSAPSALALGLGEPRQTSALNQPLHVLFPLTDTTGLAPEQITVTLGDEAAYQRAGLERTALLDGLSSQVVGHDGRLAVELESERRVRDPFLDLLLVVTWPDGQWQRQVSLLFDPAGYAQAQPLLSGDAGKAPVSVSPAPRLASANPPAGGASASAWPTRLAVQSGDSLSSLAASLLSHDGVGRHALMLALYRANPEAFVGGDVDRLRAGVTLVVPSAAEIAGQAEGAALAALRQHTSRSPAEADDGLTAIEIESARQQGEADVAPLGVIASLQSQVAALTADKARQQAALDSLEAQRDRLAAALGALSPTAEDTSTTPAAPVLAGAIERGDGTAILPAVETAAADVMAAPVADQLPANALPWWQWPLAHPVGAGSVALACLLALWGVQRSRGRRGRIEPAEGESATDTPETLETAEVMSDADAAETKAAKSGKSGKRSRLSLSRGRTDSNRETESSVIDQADIYLAYGRYEEARDWLVPRLDDDPEGRRRLGLIRALGELRDLDGMEATFARIDATLPATTRQQAQVLVDEYRARYVEESWEEATAGAATAGAGAAIDDVDALFEAETRRQPASVAPAAAVSVASDGAAPLSPAPAPASLATPDSLARSEAFEAAPRAISIAYEPPPLEWSSTSLDDDAAVEPAALSQEATLEFAPLPGVVTPLGDGESGEAGRDPEAPVASPREHDASQSAQPTAIPDDWEVEVVEFHSPHRDNRRP
ncbi:FimV/HubP family polar landmark protein [Salinicola avicenniae]|uniref:FimV/HubP family polar landmark protein n=1 Tax=Salinicola avicenniae TaxID=2916836 RepID=UPI00207486A1|nr:MULTISPECIES: FimV/HubP family polar landmark protein [unclassified Salinicola]